MGNIAKLKLYQEHQLVTVNTERNRMTVLSWILCLVCLLKILIIPGAYGVDIQFFSGKNLTGLIWRKNSSDDNWRECIDTPVLNEATSIETDTCFVLLDGQYCKSARSEKYLPGNVILSENSILSSYNYKLRSIYICNEAEGANQLNVDITRHFEYHKGFPNVLQSYKNVCSCVNIPQYVQNMSSWSINNHHNDLLAYYEPNCSEEIWTPTIIPAGYSHNSRNMQAHQKIDSITMLTYKIQSFGPDPHSHYFKTSSNSTKSPTNRKKLANSTELPPNMESTTKSGIGENTSTTEPIQQNRQICCFNIETKISQLEGEYQDLSLKFSKSVEKVKYLESKIETMEVEFNKQLNEYKNYTDKIKADLLKLFA